MRRALALALTLVGLSVTLPGCGTPGPVESGPIAVRITGNGGDVRQPGLISRGVTVSTPSSNPWGEWVQRARAECKRDPVAFEVRSVSATSASAFTDFVSGTLTIIFAPTTSGGLPTDPKVTVASVANPTGTGPISLTVSATRSSLAPLYQQLLGASFEVVLQAQTNRTAQETFTFDVTVTLNALAICE